MSGNKRVSRRFMRGAVIPAAVAWMGLVGASVGLMQALCVPPPPAPPPLSANAGADATVAVGSTVALSGSAAGGTVPYSYLWQQTAGVTQTLTNANLVTASVSGVAAGPATFQLTVTDAAGATATDTVVITVSAASSNFTVDAGADLAAVGGATVTLTATATNGVSPIGWSWLLISSGTAGSFVLSNANIQTAQATFTADAVGPFTFQVTGTDAASATATDVVVVTLSAAPPGALVFTLDIDNLPGTPGDDTFTAQALWSGMLPTGLSDTFQTGDQAAGGAGADVLNCTLQSGVAPVVSLDAIETLNFTVFTADAVTATSWTGVTDINMVNGSAALTVLDLPAVADLGITNTVANLIVQHQNAAVTDAADALTLTLDRANGNTVLLNSTAPVGEGVEIINVASGGTADNTLAALVSQDSGGTDLLETVNVTGDQALEITAALAATVETFNASASTGGVTVGFAPGADVTATGGSGDDSFDLSGGYDTSDIIEGGTGTNTLVVNSAEAVAVAADQTNVTNVQNLAISDAIGGNIDLAFFVGADTLTSQAGINGDWTLTVATGNAVTIEADGATADDDLTIAVDTNGSGVNGDTVTVNLADTVDDDGTITGDLVLDGFEAATITTGGGFRQQVDDALIINPDAAGVITTTVTITGDDDLDAGTITADVTDASGFAGDLTATLAAASTITGGAGDDTLTGSAGIDTINGGTGDDTLDGAAGADAITGGDGDDDITGGAGNDSMTGGAGEDTFVFTGPGDVTAGTPDVIADFVTGADADVLRFNDGGGAFNIGNADGVLDGFEVVAGAAHGPAAEVSVITTAVAGALTSANAATAIGNATGAFLVGDVKLFVVSNGTDSAVFLFTSAAADATVTAAELAAGPIIRLTGVDSTELAAMVAANFLVP